MTVVAGVFLDHVQVYPPQRELLAGKDVVKTPSGHGSTRPVNTGLVARQVVGGAREVDLVVDIGDAWCVIPVVPLIWLAVEPVKPRFNSRQVPNKAEK